MNFIIFILTFTLFAVVPVMIAAKLLGAKRTTFWLCVLAVIASIAAGHSAEFIATDTVAIGLLTVLITAICFSVILGTRYLQSLLIALLSYGIQYGAAFMALGLGLFSVIL